MSKLATLYSVRLRWAYKEFIHWLILLRTLYKLTKNRFVPKSWDSTTFSCILLLLYSS